MVCYLSMWHNPQNSMRLILGMQRICVCVCVTCARPCVCACLCVCMCVCARVCLRTGVTSSTRLVVSSRCISRRKVTALLVWYMWLQPLCAFLLFLSVSTILVTLTAPLLRLYLGMVVVWPSCMLHTFTHCLGMQEMGKHAAETLPEQQAEALPEQTCSYNSAGEFPVQNNLSAN